MPHRAHVLEVVLKPGRDRALRRRHPWVMSGAVASVEGEAAPGAWARVRSAEGRVLGSGHWSPSSQIRVRLLQHGDAPAGDELIAARVAEAVARRAGDALLAGCDALRLVNGEGDGLPGLVVDRYADTVVVRLSTAGMAARRDLVARALAEAAGASRGFERADGTAARREGFAPRDGVLFGPPPPDRIVVRERGRRYAVDVRAGQKTGFYLDQRDARDLVERVARGRHVLDLFAYTGGFAVAAARGGADSVTLVESSPGALALADDNLAANAPTAKRHLVRGDAFDHVRRASARFDLVVADPPPLARRRGDAPRAARAYRALLASALRRAAPHGLVLAFSCSHHFGPERLLAAAFAASLETGRRAQLVGRLGAPSDHPVCLDHPEGAYLSGVMLRASGAP